MGAVRFGKAWAIPVDTEKPSDARVKSGKYIKYQGEEKNMSDQKIKLFSFFFRERISGFGF